jgi:hypothetical protein
MKETINVRRYLTKVFNKDNTVPFAWYNTEFYKLSKNGIEELERYIKDKEFIRYIIIASEIEVTRPQRTWGDMPEWFRPASICNHFDENNYSNTFIFSIYESEWGGNITEDEIREAVKSFPKNAEIYILKKKGKTQMIARDINLKDIKIKEDFKKKQPGNRKMYRKWNYYRRTGRLESDIVLDKNNFLIDGYTSYLIAEADGIKKLDVIIKK